MRDPAFLRADRACGRCNGYRYARGLPLDLDSTVFERYGEQEQDPEGTTRGDTAAQSSSVTGGLSEAHFLLHGWLPSGQLRNRRGAEEFLKEALATVGTGGQKNPPAES